MFAYNINRSRIGAFGFDTINLYTNDGVYCSDFQPTENEVQLIGNFITQMKNAFFSEQPISLFITYKNGRFLTDSNAYLNEQPIFASATGKSIEEVLRALKHKLIIDSIFPWESTTQSEVYPSSKGVSSEQLSY